MRIRLTASLTPRKAFDTKALFRAAVLETVDAIGVTAMIHERAERPHQSVDRMLFDTPTGIDVIWEIRPPRAHEIVAHMPPWALHFNWHGDEVFFRRVWWHADNPPKEERYAPVFETLEAALAARFGKFADIEMHGIGTY